MPQQKLQQLCRSGEPWSHRVFTFPAMQRCMEFLLKPDFLWLLGSALHSRDVPRGAFEPPLCARDSLGVQIPTRHLPAAGSSPRLAQTSNCIALAESYFQLHFAGGQSCVPMLAMLGLMSQLESIMDHSQNQDLHGYRYTLLHCHTVRQFIRYNATSLFMCLLLSQALIWGIFLCRRKCRRKRWSRSYS